MSDNRACTRTYPPIHPSTPPPHFLQHTILPSPSLLPLSSFVCCTINKNKETKKPSSHRHTHTLSLYPGESGLEEGTRPPTPGRQSSHFDSSSSIHPCNNSFPHLIDKANTYLPHPDIYPFDILPPRACAVDPDAVVFYVRLVLITVSWLPPARAVQQLPGGQTGRASTVL